MPIIMLIILPYDKHNANNTLFVSFQVLMAASHT